MGTSATSARTQGRARRDLGSGPRPSAVAMALCLLIVAGAVLFGLFGPGIAQRSMLGGAVSIGDLVSNAIVQRDQLLGRALERSARNRADLTAAERTPSLDGRGAMPEDARGGAHDQSGSSGSTVPMDSSGTTDPHDSGSPIPDSASMESSAEQAGRTAAREAIARILGRHADIPDLSSAGYELAAWATTSLSGMRDDAVALGYLDPARRSFVALYLVADDGQFVFFDDFGRAVGLAPDRLLVERLPRTSRDEGVALVWSTGPVVAIAIVDSADEASALRELLGAP